MIKILYQIRVNGVNYLIDKNAEIKEDGTYCLHFGKTFGEGELYKRPTIDKITFVKVTDQYCRIDGAKFWKQWDKNPRFSYSHVDLKKVVAVEYPHKVEGLHQYKLPDEIEELSKNYVRNETDETLSLISKHSFKDGYKANKKLYTKEDMREAMENAINWWAAKLSEKYGEIDNIKDFGDIYLQSLHNNREIKNIEVEFEQLCHQTGLPCGFPCNGEDNCLKSLYPKLNNEGFLIIKKINYK